MINKNFEAWSLKNTVNFYQNERTRAADLYQSESAMLLPVVPRVKSVLDVGCAVGNFYSVFRELNPAISYVGIDTSQGMIDEARRRYPGIRFDLSKGHGLPYESGSFDLVLCTGVLNHNPDYLDMISEILRVTRRFAVVDLPRLVTWPYTFDLKHSYMQLKDRFPEKTEEITEEATRVPYVLASVSEAFNGLLNRLSKGIMGVACCGYYGTPHKSVTIPYEKVIFTVILLIKGHGQLRYHLRLPDDAMDLAESAFLSAQGIKAESVESVFSAGRT